MSAVVDADRVRGIARRLLGRGLYHAGARCLDAAQVIRREGYRTWRALGASAGGEPVAELRLRDIAHPIAWRPGTPDAGAIVQNLVRFEYGRLPVGLRPRLIVDAGGYIGDVSIYFLNRYPDARVVTLEPDPANVALARRNLAPYGDRVRLVQAGLWSRPVTLRISGQFTGARLGVQDAGVEVPCVDLDTVLADSGAATIDVLKLDIEGAEEQVLLEHSAGWLPRTGALIVEFHGADIERRCSDHLRRCGFQGFRYRSLHYFFNGARP